MGLMSLPVLLIGQEKQTLAVLDFDAIGISAQEARILTNRLRTNLVLLDIYSVIDRGNMEQILEEQDFQLAGCTSDECAVEVGQLLGAKLILAGSIGKIGQIFSIELRLIEVETGEIVKSSSYDAKGEVDMLLTQGIPEAARKIAGIEVDAVPSPQPPEPVATSGTLGIVTSPSGADLHVDGRRRGRTPVSSLELEGGRHAIRLSLNRYETLDTNVVVQAGQHTILRFSLLSISTGSLNIYSQPSGADVTFNGSTQGKTPLFIGNKQAGEYSLTLSKTDYKSLDTTVNVLAGKTAWTTYTLKSRMSTLTINSTPLRAAVIIDGKPRGTTPMFRVALLADTTHTIKFQLTGYNTVEKSVFIRSGQNAPISVKLEQITNLLSLEGPEATRVQLFREVGVGTVLETFHLPHEKVRLPVGRYQLTASKPEFFAFDTSFTLTNVKETAITVSLEKKPQGPAVVLSTLLPGSGYMYLGRPAKGFLYLVSTLALAVVAYQSHADFLNHDRDYRANLQDYRNATDQTQISALRDAAGDSYDAMTESLRSRNLMAGIMGAVWAVDLLHITIDLRLRSK